MSVNRKHTVIKDLAITVILLAAAWSISEILLPLTGVENNSAMVFVAVVVLISRLTEGYLYGAAAAVIGTFLINIFFMVPYAQFTLAFNGYPVAFISLLTVSGIVCALTGRLKKHALEAVEREKQTRELYEQNARLEKEKNEAELANAKAEIRSNILLAVSHDLRTPLTAISGSANYILTQGEAGCSKENLKLIDDIKQDAEWLTVMVENILTVTKVQDRSGDLKMSAEILEEIIGASVIKLKRRFPDSRVELEMDPNVMLVEMDPLLMQQVFINLMENVIRHADSSKPMVVKTKAVGEKVLISVRDYGQGIRPDVLEQIKRERPVMVDRRGDSYRGMGIGLSVCQSILKAHGSRLEAENVKEEEGGARFYFSLNRVSEEEEYCETEDNDR